MTTATTEPRAISNKAITMPALKLATNPIPFSHPYSLSVL
jgi:hypothetical protein